MSKTVVINVFHPALRASRNNRRWSEAAHDAGYLVRDLYQLYTEGVIDVLHEQQVAEAASVLVFQHPMHWYSAPWLLKRWIDEVLTYGWAYGGSDRLAGKTWVQAVTVGAGSDEYGITGSRRYTAPEFLRPFERTAAFCKMEFATYLRYGTGYASEETIAHTATEYFEFREKMIKFTFRSVFP